MEEDKEPRITPAALGALARGDLENFMVAATPGGIEAQEAAGQQTLVNSDTLPHHFGMGADKAAEIAKFEAIGIKFGEEVDELFSRVEMPPGWKKVPTDHSMWSELRDDKGRKRAGIFYKAAFYDRSAFMRLEPRFRATVVPEDEYKTNMDYEARDKGNWYGIVYDGEETAFKTAGAQYGEGEQWKMQERLEKEAVAWLEERYPDWRDATKYWDDTPSEKGS